MRRTWQRLVTSLRPAVDEAPIVAAAGSLTVTDVVRRFWPRLRPLRGWLLLGMLLLAAAPAISVAEVLLFQRLVDDVLVPATLEPLIWIAAIYVGLNLLSAVVSGCDDYLSTWVSQRFLVKLRTQVFSHVLAHPGHVHDRKRLGDTMSRLTSDTARAAGLTDRGLLRPGLRADVNVIDFDRLALHRPGMVRDLPAGGRRLLQPVSGYVATVCGGEVTYRDGIATGVLPGRLVRAA